jgi:prepilin-type N-terminal cleavage/methylation domain-containing protein
MKGKNGYGLLELLIVLGVSALLVSMAVPAFSSWDDHCLQSEAEHMAVDLRYLQSISRMELKHRLDGFDSQAQESRTMAMVIQRAGSRYYYEIMERGEDGREAVIRSHYLPQGMWTASDNTNVIRFSRQGEAEAPATIFIGSGSGMMGVVIDLAGRIRLEKE